MFRLLPFISCLCLLAVQTSLTADSGQIQGTVPLPQGGTPIVPAEKYIGKVSGKVAPTPRLLAGVWLENTTLTAPANPKRVTLTQANYQFSNSLIVIPKGTSVAFPNNDSDYHNIYSLSRAKSFDLGRYKKSENPAPVVTFDKLGFISLHCEIHDHMKANIIVVDSPYYTVSTATGAFTLKNVPPGKYILHAQFARKSTWKTPVQVRRNQTTQVQFLAK